MSLPTIGSLWIGPRLSFLEVVVIRSYLDAGHPIVLFTLGPLENVPEGVELRDAREVFAPPYTDAQFAENHIFTAIYSDTFRLHMIQDLGYIWADLDAYCVKPYDFESGYLLAYQNPRGSVANGILGLPPTSEALHLSLAMLLDPAPVLPFSRPGKQRRAARMKRLGRPFGFENYNWGASGPRVLTHFLNETGEIIHAQPPSVFIPFETHHHMIVFDPDVPLDRIERPETYSVHLFGLTRVAARDQFNGVLPDGCYLDTICKRHGVDPAAFPV
ncbi:hypothetical protein FHS89_000844 [Rubricella aquisinus]|uniref:Uncharacterized protein n=1 Tax=Rubricella aquisinus TaxID=2028108 RepID=A0A840WI84_9RHOB|nr:hypothetical protein [Rubricella aquisinus]MBB5514838.1 hypothetical protein [Rubricella aquisinus]